MITYTINFDPVCKFTDEQFYQLCRKNPEIKFERNARGEIVIMSPTGGKNGNRNAEIMIKFGIWNRQTQLGTLFDSSTCFRLPDGGGGDRSPEVAWIRQERWDTLTPEQKQKIPPIAPNFVLELMSPTDNLKVAPDKMKEYMNSQV
jgi:Uma2 family endonuclease